MHFKPDWPECQKYFKAWWDCDRLDRPSVAFWAPRDEPLPGAPPEPPEPSSPEDRHLDVEALCARAERFMCRNRLFAEAFPHVDVNIGPGSLALYLGSEPGFSERTVWFNHLAELQDDPERVELPTFDPENPWWRRHHEMIRRAVEIADGRYLVTIPDLVENIDILASLRGTQNVLVDLMDRPEWVKAWLERIDELYFEYFDRFHELVAAPDGSNAFTAFWVWGPGRTAKVQCDFAAMIGPGMFAEFVAPGLARQCARLDYSVYHLDGPEAVCHVPCLCDIPDLNAIQWTPGAAHPGVGDPCWFDLYRDVLSRGKGLLLISMTAEEAERVAREVGTQGVFMLINDVESEAEGEALMDRMRHW